MYWMLSGRVMCAISLFEPIFACVALSTASAHGGPTSGHGPGTAKIGGRVISDGTTSHPLA